MRVLLKAGQSAAGLEYRQAGILADLHGNRPAPAHAHRQRGGVALVVQHDLGKRVTTSKIPCPKAQFSQVRGPAVMLPVK